MKVLERYYEKIYKYTNKLLRKIFGFDVTAAMAENYRIKSEIEKKIEKSIEMITTEDLINHKLSYLYCKYRTINKILEVISGAAFVNSFCKDDIKEIKDED
jgi:hypothetical protein